MVAPITTYEDRIKEELRAYEAVEEVHNLPAIYHYWSERYALPLLHEVGVAGLDELWDRYAVEICLARYPERARLVSLGSGNGETELEVAARLAEQGIENLDLELLELNPAMIDRARAYAQRLGLQDVVSVQPTDLNTWVATEPADLYLAVHSLHHIVELEHLYDQVRDSMRNGGALMVNDMIGRNGHARWPEAAVLVNQIWATLPERLRYNHYTQEIDDTYPDWDCAGEGFEGVRAEEVLPRLLERLHPEVLVTFANVIDPFVDRVYGPNFDVDDEHDRALIDSIAEVDERAIDLGILTPTHLFGVFRKEEVACRFPRDRTPDRVVREPEPESTPVGARPEEREPIVADVAAHGDDQSERIRSLEQQLLAVSQRYEALRSRKIVRLGLGVADSRHKLPRRRPRG